MKTLSSLIVVAATAVAVVAGSSGCAHMRRNSAAGNGQQEPLPATSPTLLVVGGRVRVFRGGETVEVPQPTPPARVWYLVDNVGLNEWLGLDIPYTAFVTNDAQRSSSKVRAAIVEF